MYVERSRPPIQERERLEPAISFGQYLPENQVSNPDEIASKSGVVTRFVAQPFETPEYMGTCAANEALHGRSDIDLLIATSSYPSTSHLAEGIADKLRIQPRHALDVYAACSGFAEALYFLKENEDYFTKHNKVLIVSSELYSPTLLDPDHPDRESIDPSRAKYLFSDGAYAMNFSYGKDIRVLSSVHGPIEIPEGEVNPLRMPIRSENFVALNGPYISQPVPFAESGYFEQNGRMVLKMVGKKVPEMISHAIQEAGIEAGDVDMVIPHQGSKIIVDIIDHNIALPVVQDVAEGNFSSASIPKAMDREIREGRLRRGNTIVAAGFGAGLFGSASVVRL